MSRDAIYRYNFTSATNGWLYRLEMIPSDDKVFLSNPIGSAPFIYIDFPEGCITVKEPEAGFDKLPIGMSLESRLSFDIDLTLLSSSLRSYIWNPVTAGGGFIRYIGSNTGDVFDTTREFDTLNVWQLFTDAGTGTLSACIFRGVQKPRIETEISLNPDSDVIAIDLVDLGKFLLEKITASDIDLFMRSSEIEGLEVTNIHEPDVKNSDYAFDYLYTGDSIGIYGKADYAPAAEYAVVGGGIGEVSKRTSSARFYKLASLFGAIADTAAVMINSFVRQQGAFNLSGSPYAGLTFFKQDYTTTATRGASIAFDDLWYIGHVVRTESISDTYEFAGGFLHQNSAYGFAKNYPSAWDLLVDITESCGAIGVVAPDTMAAHTLKFKKIKSPLDGGGTLSLSDFVRASATLKITIGYECLRACKVDTIGMSDKNVGGIEYVGEGVLSESDYAIRTAFHNIPTLTDEYFASNIDFLDNTQQAILKENIYYSNKIYYFDTPDFCDQEVPVLAHRTADYDNGDGGVNYGQTYTLPSLPTSNPLWYTVGYRRIYARFVSPVIIDMQRRDNISYTAACAITSMFSNPRQVLIEQDGFIPKFLPTSVGEIYDFDLAGIRSWLTDTPTEYVLVETTPKLGVGTASIKLVGV